MCDRKLCLQSQLQVLRCLVSATFVNQKAEYCRSFLSFGLDGKQLWTFFMLFFYLHFYKLRSEISFTREACFDTTNYKHSNNTGN